MDIDPCEEQFPFEVQMEEHDDVSIFIYLFHQSWAFRGGGGLYIYNNMII